MRYAALVVLPLAACASKPPEVVRVEIVHEASAVPPQRHFSAAPIAPRGMVAAQLAAADAHIGEADRYVAWDKSKSANAEKLRPLVAQVAAAKREVRDEDRRHHAVTLRAVAKLRAAQEALSHAIQTKGD